MKDLVRLIGSPLTKEDVRRYLEHPVSDAEREDVLALVRWFQRRYPTPEDRLGYVRRAYGRWIRNRPGG